MEKNRRYYRKSNREAPARTDGLYRDSSSPLRDFVRRHLFWIVILCITVAALGLRLSTYYFRTDDYTSYLSVWYRELQTHGLGYLPPTCNYNLPYVTILYLLGLVTDNSLASIKAVSIAFDFALAGAGAMLLYDLLKARGERRRLIAAVTYTGLLLLPEVVLNSGIWAQCDSIYATFCVLAVLFLVRRQHVAAFVFMGIALAFKLQAVFLLPLFVLVWLSDKKCHLLHFLLIPGTMLVCGIPAAVAGRSIWSIFTIYTDVQIVNSANDGMSVNYPNLYSFIGEAEYAIFKRFAIILTLIMMGLAAAIVLRAHRRLSSGEILLLGGWCGLLCTFFLPAMRERYVYMADILVCLFALYTRRRGDLIGAATIAVIAAIPQTRYLFGADTAPDWALALVRLACIVYLTVRVLQQLAPQVLERPQARREIQN